MDRGKRPVVFDEDDEEPIRIDGSHEVTDTTVSMCLLGKLWTDRPYNTYGLMETMKKLWCPAKGMICRDMGANLISFQFNNKRDMDRVIAMEPWHFNKHILVLKKISTDIQPSMMKFDRSPYWIRLYDVPLLARKEEILKQIGRRFGEVIEIDANTTTGITRSVRIRITLDLNKPLKRGTKICIGSGAPCWIPVTYERLPSFCYWCGHLGHTCKDCEAIPESENQTDYRGDADMPFGEFLKSSPMKTTQVMSDRIQEDKGDIRRSLFQKRYQKPSSETESDEKVVGPTASKNDYNTKEMSELLQSLKKVEVGNKADTEKPIDTPTMSTIIPPCRGTLPNPTHVTHSTGTHKQHIRLPYVTNLPTSEPSTTNQKTPKPLTKPIPIHQPTQPNLKPIIKPPQLPNKPPHIHTQPPITPPYTPTATLIAMIQNQAATLTQSAPTKPSPLINHMDTNKPAARIKTEPPSPAKTQRSGKSEEQVKQKTWKRQKNSAIRTQETSSNKTGKRKEDEMDIDSTHIGVSKKTKCGLEDSSIATAETATQSRRSL